MHQSSQNPPASIQVWVKKIVKEAKSHRGSSRFWYMHCVEFLWISRRDFPTQQRAKAMVLWEQQQQCKSSALRLYSTSLFIKECRGPLNLFCFAFREMEKSDQTNSFRQIVEQLVCTLVNRKDKNRKKSRKEDLENTRSKLQIQNPVNLSVTGKEEGCVWRGREGGSPALTSLILCPSAIESRDQEACLPFYASGRTHRFLSIKSRLSLLSNPLFIYFLCRILKSLYNGGVLSIYIEINKIRLIKTQIYFDK